MTLEVAAAPDGAASPEVLRLAYLNAAFETGIDNPLDVALVAAGEKAGLTTVGQRKIDEIPYDFLRKRLTIVIAPEAGGPHLIVTKGAFANVLATCTRIAHDGGDAPLDDAERARLKAWFRAQGTRGLRLLGLATREVGPRGGYTPDDEAGMCFTGFLLFLDPPKATVRTTLERLAARGVGIKIVTGDNRYVAAHVAESVGLDASAMLTGEQIAAMKDEALWHHAEKTVLFVEVDPQQKERIVRALQHRGHAVGYLGDGINDLQRPACGGATIDRGVEVRAIDRAEARSREARAVDRALVVGRAHGAAELQRGPPERRALLAPRLAGLARGPSRGVLQVVGLRGAPGIDQVDSRGRLRGDGPQQSRQQRRAAHHAAP